MLTTRQNRTPRLPRGWPRRVRSAGCCARPGRLHPARSRKRRPASSLPENRTISGTSLPGGSPPAPASRHRPGPAVRRPGVQALVPSPRHSPAIRGHRQVWQPGRHGAGTDGLLLLVQRPPASYTTRRRDPRRDLPSSPPRRSGTALRTAPSVAAALPLRVTPRSHSRSAGSPPGYRRPLSRRTAAPPRRLAEARSVGAVGRRHRESL